MVRGTSYLIAILILSLALAPAALAVSAGPKAVIGRAECRALLASPAVPRAAYEPGVDVNGRSVAPADLGGTAPPLGDVTIDLRTLLGQLPGANVPPILSSSEIHEGEIRIGLAHGQVTLNGQPLAPDGTAAVRAACRKAGR